METAEKAAKPKFLVYPILVFTRHAALSALFIRVTIFSIVSTKNPPRRLTET